MLKTAHYYRGKADALVKLGFAPEVVSAALVRAGLEKSAADEMTKEAFFQWLAGMAGKIAPKITQFGASAAKWGGNAPGAKSWLGNMASRAAGGLSKGMQSFSANPAMASKGFGKNLLSGAFTGQGQGVGGTIGQGLNYAQQAKGYVDTTRGFFGSNQQQPQPAY